MMTKHTAGPWNAWPNPGEPTIYEGGDAPATIRADGRYIAAIQQQAGESMANARLIAAAPDLLEACEEMLSFIKTGHNPEGPAARMLGAAIAKAKGDA